jgi:CheY-like chemotaxis protein
VLVVDDEPDVAALLADMLAVDGHRVETAPNGAIALQKLKAGAYDVILSDLRMPELDGPGLHREIERHDAPLARRFIFISGDTLNAQTRAFLEKVGAPTVAKPFDPDALRRAVYGVAE